ncbi:MAG: hypothetical protein WCI95_01490 [bacterium]
MILWRHLTIVLRGGQVLGRTIYHHIRFRGASMLRATTAAAMSSPAPTMLRSA